MTPFVGAQHLSLDKQASVYILLMLILSHVGWSHQIRLIFLLGGGGGGGWGDWSLFRHFSSDFILFSILLYLFIYINFCSLSFDLQVLYSIQRFGATGY